MKCWACGGACYQTDEQEHETHVTACDTCHGKGVLPDRTFKCSVYGTVPEYDYTCPKCGKLFTTQRTDSVRCFECASGHVPNSALSTSDRNAVGLFLPRDYDSDMDEGRNNGAARSSRR